MDQENINQTQKVIGEWIAKLKFKKKTFFGVDEADVYKKIEELNDLYEKALLEERTRYETLLRQQEREGGIENER